jgi:hypothetical protein
MTAMHKGYFTTIALRNAIAVTQADVDYGVSVNVAGTQYLAVAAGTGAACWAPRDNLASTTAPAVTDDLDLGYKVGSRWVDVTGDRLFTCIDATDGAAIWVETPKTGAWAGACVAGTNVASITAACTGSYIRIGTRVFLFGNVAAVDPTAGAPTATDFTVALPIASNIGAIADANGVAAGTEFTGVCSGSVADNVLVVTGVFRANTTTNVGITASYVII